MRACVEEDKDEFKVRVRARGIEGQMTSRQAGMPPAVLSLSLRK